MSLFWAQYHILLFILIIFKFTPNGTGIANDHVYKFKTNMRTPNAHNTRMDY